MTKSQQTFDYWLGVLVKFLVGMVVTLIGVVETSNFKELGSLADDVKKLNEKIDAFRGELMVTKAKADRNERDIERLEKR